MDVKYVVSIAGELLHFDEARQPVAPLPDQASDVGHKPELKLLPPAKRPAAEADWDAALAGYSAAQRAEAEISVVLR